MKCEFILERLDDYLDGLMDAEKTEQYLRHLQECQDCQALKKQIFQVQNGYSVSTPEPSRAKA